MKNAPLDLRPGDIVWIDLAHPQRYGDGQGGEELRYFTRVQVDEVSALGISGRGHDQEGLIVPHKTKEFEKLGTGEKVVFFPWSSVQSLHLMYRFADYERLFDGLDV